jgi:hypothetical protein
MCGQMNSGKSYTTKKLLEKIPPQNVIILDPHNEYGYIKDIFLRVKPTRPYDVTWVDDLIKTCYDNVLYRKVVVFDDMDLFIHRDKESEKLADWFVDSSHIGTERGLTKEEAGSGSIILCKRPVSLDKRILQACRWIFLFKGCLYEDVDMIRENCGLDRRMMGNPLEQPEDKDTYLYVDRQPLSKHPYLLIDAGSKTFKYREGVLL